MRSRRPIVLGLRCDIGTRLAARSMPSACAISLLVALADLRRAAVYLVQGLVLLVKIGTPAARPLPTRHRSLQKFV
jgi:hypothetical protein